MSRWLRVWTPVLATLFYLGGSLCGSRQVYAGEPERTAAAKASFLDGTRLVSEARWAEALASFERANEIAPHAVTLFNAGACERALGRYQRARRRFQEALKRNERSEGAELSTSLTQEARGYIAEIELISARITLAVEPAGSSLLVDGRPLDAGDDGKTGEPMIAGVRPAGEAEPAPPGERLVLFDPGPHVMLFTRKGYANAVVRRSFAPSERTDVRVSLDTLPATLRITANEKGALVTIDGNDVGPVPVDVRRPAGSHRVVVRHPGFLAHEASITVAPGEEINLRAPLVREKRSVFTTWWFWTAASAVVGAATVTTYFITRPEPQRPPVPGGTTGWVVTLP